jgi:DNA-binding GntR family transcriptional regulator
VTRRGFSPPEGVKVADHRKRAGSVLTSVWNHPVQKRITMTYRQGADYQNKVVDDHRQILAALKAEDASRAIELLQHCHDVADPNRAQNGVKPAG